MDDVTICAMFSDERKGFRFVDLSREDSLDGWSFRPRQRHAVTTVDIVCDATMKDVVSRSAVLEDARMRSRGKTPQPSADFADE